MHPHTKFEIPTSTNIGDMHWTGSRTYGLTNGRTDERTDGRTNEGVDSAITIRLSKFLRGHKNSFAEKLSS